jgi:HTH-type transcriptional regulator, sugar sensing transcriptional regulator
MLTKQLQGLGFTEKEARVYIGLLELGEATALELSQKTSLNRATTYVTLAGLEKRKLVGQIENHKKTIFSIEHPLQILDLLEKEKNSVEIKIHLAKSLMPELEMLEKVTGEKAKVKFYEGKEGIAIIQKEFVRAKPKEWLNIFNINIALKYFPITKNDHRQIVRDKKMSGRGIAVYDPKISIPNLPPFPNSEMRYLPLTKFNMPFNAEVSIFNDKAVLISYQGKLMAVVVQNKAIVNGLKLLFELAWQGSEKYLQIKKGA